MSMFRDYMPSYLFGVMSLHTERLNLDNLNEAYRDLHFTKEEALHSLEYVKLNLIHQTEDDIIDDLNDEFVNVYIMFRKFKQGNVQLKPLYPQAGIISADYDTDDQTIVVNVNDTFINNFKNNKLELLATAITAIGAHEDTHRQQYFLSKGKVKGTNQQTLQFKTLTDFQRYLENPTEIDAHAREVAIYLYNLKITGNNIVTMLKMNHKNLLNSTAYKKYWDIFGIVTKKKDNYIEDDLNKLKTWKRFLKRIVAYLQTTSRFKYNIEPRDAIKHLDDLENKIKQKLNL